MRNLAKYPLTAEETADLLVKIAAQAIPNSAPGDMTAYTLTKTMRFIKDHEEEFNEFCAKSLQLAH